MRERDLYRVSRLTSRLEKLVQSILGAEVDKLIVIEIQVVQGEIDGVIVVCVLEGLHKSICPHRLAASLEASQAENEGAFG